MKRHVGVSSKDSISWFFWAMCCGVVDCLFYVLQDFSRDHYDFKQLQIYLYFHAFDLSCV